MKKNIKTTSGLISEYGFICNYQQVFETDFLRVYLYLEHSVYHVKLTHGEKAYSVGHIEWETFKFGELSKARKKFNEFKTFAKKQKTTYVKNRKNYIKVILQESGNVVYKLQEYEVSINITAVYSKISNTFISLEFKFSENSIDYMFKNLWFSRLGVYNIESILKQEGFVLREAYPQEIKLITRLDVK